MCWYSVELDGNENMIASNDGYGMESNLVRVVEEMEYQLYSAQTTFVVILAKWKERTRSTSPLGNLISQAANIHGAALFTAANSIRLVDLSRQIISNVKCIGRSAAKL